MWTARAAQRRRVLRPAGARPEEKGCPPGHQCLLFYPKQATQEANAQKKEAAEKVAGLPKPMAPDPMKQASASGELRVVGGQQEPLRFGASTPFPADGRSAELAAVGRDLSQSQATQEGRDRFTTANSNVVKSVASEPVRPSRSMSIAPPMLSCAGLSIRRGCRQGGRAR